MFGNFRYHFFQLFAKLSIFTLLIAFFTYFTVDTLKLLSNSGNQYVIEIYEYEGSEEEKNNESEDEVKEIDDFLFSSTANKSNNNFLLVGKITGFDIYQNFKKNSKIYYGLSAAFLLILFLSILLIIFLSDSLKKPKGFMFSFTSEITIVSSPLS